MKTRLLKRNLKICLILVVLFSFVNGQSSLTCANDQDRMRKLKEELGLYPDKSSDHFQSALFYDDLGEDLKAIIEFKMALIYDPLNIEVSLKEIQTIKKTLNSFLKDLEIYPNNYLNQRKLLEFLKIEISNFEKEIVDLTKALGLLKELIINPNNHNTRDKLQAFILEIIEYQEDSLDAFEIALESLEKE